MNLEGKRGGVDIVHHGPSVRSMDPHTHVHHEPVPRMGTRRTTRLVDSLHREPERQEEKVSLVHDGLSQWSTGPYLMVHREPAPCTEARWRPN